MTSRHAIFQSPATFGHLGDSVGSSIPMSLDMGTSQNLNTSSFSTQDIACSYDQTPSQSTQNAFFIPLQNNSLNATYDPPMSFRDRHRFLDGVYNSNPSPETISAKNLENISRRAGLSMEEVLSWFEDERERRTRLLASKVCRSQEPGQQFPVSPADTTTPPQNSTVTLCMSQGMTSPPSSFSKLDDIFSPSLAPPTPRDYHLPVPVRAKRGRPAKNQGPESSQTSSPPEAKRRKQSIEYPCPDCKKLYAAERWSEHVKRVHFPDQVWECQKTNTKTNKICSSKPFFRPDNFGTHLRAEHGCAELEICDLKEGSKFKVVNFFHHTCGFCREKLNTRDESIEHIKDHYREISLRSQVPEDLGLSEWKERCEARHTLIRGVHYRINNDVDADADAPGDDDDPGDSGNGGPNQNDSNYNAPNNCPDQQNPNPYHGEEDGGGEGNTRGGTDGFAPSSFMDFEQCSSEPSPNQLDTSGSSSFGLEGIEFPFTALRKLGSGGYGQVDEVLSSSSREHFVRKSVIRRRVNINISSPMSHLKNELTVLKKLSHPNLVRLIGAYTDATYCHLIMQPVADQNLAKFMRSSRDGPPNRLVSWMQDLSSALAYLHGRGVKHLDIKPHNILVKGDQILLADFGAAKCILSNGTAGAEVVSFTPMYCAPETISHGRQDFSADIFSLGCVFSEMMTCYLGHTLQQFEDFRSNNGSRAFYLTIPETKAWLQQLSRAPNSMAPSMPYSISKIVCMLDDQPDRRPKASDLHLILDDMANDDSSAMAQNTCEHHLVPDRISQQPNADLPSSVHNPADPIPLDEPNRSSTPHNSVDVSQNISQTQVTASQVPGYHRLPCTQCEDHPEGFQDLQELQDHQEKQHRPVEIHRNIRDFSDNYAKSWVLDPVDRTSSVAFSDHVPSLSSGASSGATPDLSDLGGDHSHLYPTSKFGSLGLYPSVGNFSESVTYSTEYSFGNEGFDNFSLYPGSWSSGLVDPSILHPSPYEPQFAKDRSSQMSYPLFLYPSSPALSHPSRTPLPVKQDSQSPYLDSQYYNYPYPPPQRQPVLSHQSYNNDSFTNEESREKGRCTYPECGKAFKDLKAHMLTHQGERPEKCPIQTCDYHIKGFARKYDKNRHTLTHYKGTMVCGFCPGSGSSAEKSFNRADVFKRHLTSVHAVEQTPPNSSKKSTPMLNETKKKRLAWYAPDATGKCSTCSNTFSDAQDFYEHLDDCVLRIVQQEEPSEAINAARLAEIETDQEVQDTLSKHALPAGATSNLLSESEEEEEDMDDKNDDDFSLRETRCGNRSSANGLQRSRGLTHSKGGLDLRKYNARKKRKNYPPSWGCPSSQMKMKKRVLCVFDGPRRLWKSDMMLDTDTDYDVRMRMSDDKTYVTDLGVQTLRRADAFHSCSEDDRGPWVADGLTGIDLEQVKGVKSA